MTSLPLHPKIVHLPIALAVLMPLLTSGVLLAWWRNWLPRRSWLLVTAGQVLLFASAWLAMNTGEAEEDRVEPFVPEAAIEAHEEAGEAFLWGGGVVGLLAVLPILLRNQRTGRGLALVTAAGTVVVLYLGYRVGEAGGELVYRHGAAQAYTSVGGAAGSPAAVGEDDDH